MKVKVAAVQMDCVLGEKDKNIAKATKFVEEAGQKGAQLIAFPELFSTGYRLEENYYRFSEYIPEGDTVKEFEGIAKENQVYIVGCMVERGENRDTCYNSAFLVGPQGYIGKIRKAQLWGREKLYFSAGPLKREVFDTKLGKIGITICYEIGFPEIVRDLALQGADIIVELSAVGRPRAYAWDLMSRSRALENGCFVVVSDRVGKEKDTVFSGLSKIISPKGDILASAKNTESEEVIVKEIDLEDITSQRADIPYLKDHLTWLNK